MIALCVSSPSPAFQFTPLREGRPAVVDALSVLTVYFNSRPSARGDLFVQM